MAKTAQKLYFLMLFSLDVPLCALQYHIQDEVWFFILPCDWRFLPELGPPPLRAGGLLSFENPHGRDGAKPRA
jgi:hypothetical protein